MRFAVTTTVQVLHAGSVPSLEAHLDRLMDALLASKAIDPDLGGSLTNGEFDVAMIVEAADFETAGSTASRIITEAIEQSGGRVGGSAVGLWLRRLPVPPPRRPIYAKRRVDARLLPVC
jgi:hypothetical protein